MRAASRLFLLAPVAAALALAGCDDRQVQPTTTVIITPVATGNSFAISNATGNVLSFNRSGATAVQSNLKVQGLDTGENIVAIDTRSNSTATNNFKLYALTDKSNLYILDPSTGFVSGKQALKASTATPINTTACTPAVTAFTALSGASFGTDFNPFVDRLRIVSNTGQNLRVNVDTAEVTVDCAINTAAPSTSINPSAVAYTNATASTALAASTMLFYIDATTDRLLRTTNPNGGVVSEVGPLGIDVSAVNGFDIDGTDSNKAYAVLAVGTKLSLYTIDLASGAATAVSEFCGAGGTTGTAPNVTCANPANDAFKGFALKI